MPQLFHLQNFLCKSKILSSKKIFEKFYQKSIECVFKILKVIKEDISKKYIFDNFNNTFFNKKKEYKLERILLLKLKQIANEKYCNY